MGRELGIHRIDFLRDGNAVIRHSDYNLCGRNEFTNSITELFYSPKKSVCYLLVTRDDMPEKDILSTIDEVHVKVEDDYWDDKEFDIEYAYVNRARIKEICDENVANDEKELAREQVMLEDAKIARKHVTTLEEFENFSEFIDKLSKHYDGYFEEAKDYWSEFTRIEQTFGGHKAWGLAKDAPEDVAQSWILLTYSE